MSDTTEPTRQSFTPEQIDLLEKRFKAHAERLGTNRVGEISMLKWAIGGLFVLGIAATGYLSTQIRSVEEELRTEIGSVEEELRTEIESVRDELREEITANRTQIAELARGQARIEAILEERLPRNS